MSTLPEELLKLILAELKENNTKIDSVKESFTEKLETIQENISVVVRKTDELDVHVKQTRGDLESLEYTVKGNGTPGLKTKVEIFENEIRSLKKQMESLQSDFKNQNVNDKKNSTAIKVAWITAGLSGVVALIVEIVTFFTL